MRVRINRNLCGAHLAFCERCLGQFLKFPLGYERRCFETLEDDNPEQLIVELHTGDHDIVFQLDEEQRQIVAGDGWTSFVDFEVPLYRNDVKENAK